MLGPGLLYHQSEPSNGPGLTGGKLDSAFSQPISFTFFLNSCLCSTVLLLPAWNVLAVPFFKTATFVKPRSHLKELLNRFQFPLVHAFSLHMYDKPIFILNSPSHFVFHNHFLFSSPLLRQLGDKLQE